MSLDPPTYILSLQNNIRARPISWEGAVRAKTITDADLKKIKAVDKVRKDQRKEIIESDIKSYVELFLGGGDSPSIFQAAAKRPDIVQYMLVLAGDLIDDIPSFAKTLIHHPHPYKPFLPLLKPSASNPDDPIPLLTSAVLSSILSQALVASDRHDAQIEEALPPLYTVLAGLAKSTDAGLQDIAVQEYSAVLRTRESRQLFWKQKAETVAPLFDILRAAVGSGKDSDSHNVEWRRERTLCGYVWYFWSEHDILILYVQLLRLSPKEKTTRLLLSTLNNLISTNEGSLLPAAVLARLPALLQTLQSRHLSDPDLLEDLKSLTELTDEYTRTQTTFDQYAAEVNTGHLRWSPPHRNATFWRENARRILEDDKGALAKKLAEILSKTWETDKQVLAIGCNDVAWLVKEVPEKRSWLEKIGLKGRCLELMQESDETVRWESLRAVGEWLRYSFDS